MAGDLVTVTWRDGDGQEQGYTFAMRQTARPALLPTSCPGIPISACTPRTHLARQKVHGCGAMHRRSRVFFLLKLLFLPIWLPLKLIGELIEHAGRRRRHHSAGQRRYGGSRMVVVLIVAAIAVIGGIAAALGAGSNGSGKRPVSASSPTAASASDSTTAAAAASASASTTAAASVSANAAGAAGGKHSSAPVPAANTQPATGPGGCHPLSDEGTCYEPGEFCRTSDHGVTGLAGDGETITCKNNDGWRWEPAAGANNPPSQSSPPASATPTRSPSPSANPTTTPTPPPPSTGP
jgi:hypothetical protein